MKRILVLGSCGFIGSNLISYFLSKDLDVFGVDLVDVSSVDYHYHKMPVGSEAFFEFMKSEQFDCCVNASGSGNVGYSIEYPLNDFDANVNCVLRVLDSIKGGQRNCRYLHISSAAVYGSPEKVPISETDPLSPMSPYGYSKLISEVLCKEYFSLFGLPVTIIRPFSVYGEGLRKQLFWDLSVKLRSADEVCLFGTGRETRDFIHIRDLVVGIHTLINNAQFNNDVYNLGSGVETEIFEIAKIFEKVFPGRKKVSFSGEKKKGDPSNWCACVDKINAIGWRQKMELEEGIRRYVGWFLEDHKLV